MKHCLLLILTAVFLSSCSSKNQNGLLEENENPIIGKWKLQYLQNNERSNKEIDLKKQPTQVILSILDGGYFVLYDTFTDPRFNQKGFSRISEISKGQWEFLEDKKLILHHNGQDTVIVEELLVTVLNKNTLVTKGKNKKASIYKTYQGY